MSVALVCIVKNERPCLAEWLAYHLAIGIDRVIAFDNESDDGTREYLMALSHDYPIEVIAWPSRPGESPQKSAYAWAIANRLSDVDWALFIDCDEFLVLREDTDIGGFLGRLGDDVGAVAFNWLTFGSSGRVAADYGLVTQSFRMGPPALFHNNHHVKTLARVAMLKALYVHHAETSGRYIYPDGTELDWGYTEGVSSEIRHGVAHLNHYQVKSHEDFARKMARGRAGTWPDLPDRFRSAEEAETLFRALDRNTHEHAHLDVLPERFADLYAAMALR
ncbi:MAG TPA: glycosyltransferase family 2 protein [Asticcacaulis sp.]|nr:glycosyltransferase family 2 protein [Asticcacaulis sp.]